MDRPINATEFEGEFSTCPRCAYRDGFHATFKKDGGVVRWLLTCPSCREVFDIGLTVKPGHPALAEGPE